MAGFWEGVTNYFSSGDGWGDIFDGILGGISSESRSRSDKDQARLTGEFALRNTREQGREARRTAEYQTLLEKWAKDKEKEERRMGLSNFARFSPVDYGTPNYVPPAVGNMPTSSRFDDSYYDKDGNRKPIQGGRG